MRTIVRDADLRRGTEATREAAGRKLVAATHATPNGEVKRFNEEIEQFERVFRMSSTEMRERLRRGSLNETLEILRWTFLLDLRDRVQTRPR